MVRLRYDHRPHVLAHTARVPKCLCSEKGLHSHPRDSQLGCVEGAMAGSCVRQIQVQPVQLVC